MLFLSTLGNYRTLAVGLTISVVGVLAVSWSLLPYRSWTIGPLEVKHSPAPYDPSSGYIPSLPTIYSQDVPDSTGCAKQLGTPYLHNASETLVNYCTDASSSSLNCFHTRATTEKIDSFCIGYPSVFENQEKKFQLGCKLRDLTQQQLAKGIPEFSHFPSYWYETGPKAIFERHVKLDPEKIIPSPQEKGPKNYTILVRREGPSPINNPFHHLMQIFSVFLTLDVMQATIDPATGDSFYREEDYQNTQVVIFDEHVDGPFFDQWTLFAKRPVTRINELKPGPSDTVENIIVPLPGSANIFWQDKVIPDSCHDSKLLQVFSQRMLNFYGVNDPPGAPDRPLVLTFIDRTEKRSLVNKETYINDLKVTYPDMKINLVDFASLSFADQLKTVQSTDILVGVHGAGLTHCLFLRSPSALVEILPPGFNHKGFRNMASALGHRYFTTHASEHANYTTPNGWQTDDVYIERERFKGLMDAAIASMYQRGLLNKDVN